jgi:hypothetical protein
MKPLAALIQSQDGVLPWDRPFAWSAKPTPAAVRPKTPAQRRTKPE